MTIYVIKNPKPGTVAVCYDKPVLGAEAMDEKAFIEWRDAQPSTPDEPFPLTPEERISALEARVAKLEKP